MPKAKRPIAADDMRPEYDFSNAVRGKYYERFKASSNVVVLDANVSKLFPNAAAASQALRVLASASRKRGAMTFLQLVAIVVHEYDPAIRFFVDILGFELVEDLPSLTSDGRPKRWVVVRPPGAQTGLLLARADGDSQAAVVGNQHAGRVGFFLRVDDFTSQYQRMLAAGVEFVRPPRNEVYGQVAVFLDVAGNRWDLLGP